MPNVFILLRSALCAECGKQLERGEMACITKERITCLACEDLDRLVFLPSGNTALTRRARKHSPLSTIVLKFSRARRRNERQGVLVDEHALELAEKECEGDEEARARARRRAAVRRKKLDAEYVKTFAEKIGERYPACPAETRKAIAEHACLKYSGRVGRTAAAKEFSPETIDLAVRAHIRHVHTRYDELLGKGEDRAIARKLVAKKIDDLAKTWQKSG